MNFATSVRTCFSKYASFKGRASRSEYWYFFLFNVIMSCAAIVLDILLFGTNNAGPIQSVYLLAVFLPALGVSIRRLHDIARSGWWYLVIFIPLIGLILILYWTCKIGTWGVNEYGPDPLNRPTPDYDRDLHAMP